MSLKLINIGQIAEANLNFGDLTVFVGPQATGKSIALQFLELMTDTGHIQDELSRYGLDWSGQLSEFFDIYFGEGMHALWRPGKSAVAWNGKAVDVPKMVGRKRRKKDKSLFFIPAQRVLTLRDGWPRPFTDFSPGDPFAVREFSEKLRVLVEQEFGAGEKLFPQERRLKKGSFVTCWNGASSPSFACRSIGSVPKSGWCWKRRMNHSHSWSGRRANASSSRCCWDCIG
jgi:hypothetical protein